MIKVLTQKQRKAASGPKLDPAEAARLEREEIRAELARRTIAEDMSDGPKFKPSAEAKREAEARKAAGPVELTTRWRGRTFPAEAAAKPVPNPAKSWETIGRKEYSRLELADFAAEAKRLEREAKRRRPDTFKMAAVKRSAIVLLADMPAAEVAKQSRLSKAATKYAALADIAAAEDLEVSEVSEAIYSAQLLVADGTKPLEDMKTEFGYAAELTPAEVLERRRMAKQDLDCAAAQAGREALAAIGPRASAVVITNYYSFEITIAEVRPVPDLRAAAVRVEALTKPLTEARATLAAAEAKVKAAAKRKAVRPIKAAEAEADRVAAGVRKLAKRMEVAEARYAQALALQPARPAAGKVAVDLIAVPLATFDVTEAAEAGALEIADRTDRMPSAFVERGPRVRTSASWSGATSHGGRGSDVTDPTGNSAAALADGYARELAKVEKMAAELAEKTSAAAIESAREVAEMNQRSTRKASEALRQKLGRASGKYAKPKRNTKAAR